MAFITLDTYKECMDEGLVLIADFVFNHTTCIMANIVTSVSPQRKRNRKKSRKKNLCTCIFIPSYAFNLVNELIDFIY
jgi:hypothetical protein